MKDWEPEGFEIQIVSVPHFIFLSTDKIREEKREDVLLLFQKIGCFRDESVTHDLPTAVPVKSTTQEDCVRACALEEKGYSYFGLQNADKCYCGHGYGKFGKADEGLCNKPCKGNSDENCGGNSTNMVYFFGLGKVIQMPSALRKAWDNISLNEVRLQCNSGRPGCRSSPVESNKASKGRALQDALV